jgi:hypothetical protein
LEAGKLESLQFFQFFSLPGFHAFQRFGYELQPMSYELNA